jgi:hypothetical protein
MRFKPLGFFSLLIAFLFSSLISCSGGGGDSGSSGGGSNPSVQSSLSVQIQDISNWEVYQGKDNTNPNVLAIKSFSQQILMALNGIVSAISGKVAVALDLGSITTYSTTGLVSEVMRFLYLDDNIVIVGDAESGYSAIKLSNVQSPLGKILNFRGSTANQALYDGTYGYQAAAKRDYDNIVYAWYGNDIVRVDTSSVVYSNAPHFGGGSFGVDPKDRMVFDNDGNLWIGTIDLYSNGEPHNDISDANGLFKINSDFASRTQLLDNTVAIWHLFKDTQGIIWASTNKGIYRIVPGENPAKVYDGASLTKYSNQIIEYNGNIYAVIKNYFHNPVSLGINLVYDLYRWNGTTFIEICNISNNTGYDNSAFVWQGNLYVTKQGSGGTLRFNGVDTFELVNICGDQLGQIAKAYGDVIASVGNISGLVIYNLDNNEQVIKLTSANTAEGLIRNMLQSLFLDEDHSLYIGPEASGFNKLAGETFTGYELPNEIVISGIYRYGDKIYISGAGNTYYLENGETKLLTYFPTNGGRLRLYGNYLWALKDWNSWSHGRISFLNMETLEKKEDIVFDQPYKFYDVVPVPGENAVYIGVGKFDGQLMAPLPYVLKYYYTTEVYEKVYLPDASCLGIFRFGNDGEIIYGISDRRLFKYNNGSWELYCPLTMVSSVTAVKKLGKYIFITSNNDSTRGLEIVDLDSKTSEHYNSDTIALPSDQVNDLAIESLVANQYRLWFATRNGLASCNIELPVP